MEELLVLCAVLMLVLVAIYGIIYAFVRVTKYFKLKYGVSMIPSLLGLCVSLDLAVITFYVINNQTTDNKQYMLYAVCTIFVALTIYRNFKCYKNAAVLATLFQLIVAALHFVIIFLVIITIVLRRVIKSRNSQVNKMLRWFEVLTDI